MVFQDPRLQKARLLKARLQETEKNIDLKS